MLGSQGDIQPIALTLKPRVDLDFLDRRCSFLCWRRGIDAVLFRHLDRRATKVGIMVLDFPSWINLYIVDHSGYKSRVALVFPCVVGIVNMRLIDCA